jgi:hypothetical protein
MGSRLPRKLIDFSADLLGVDELIQISKACGQPR